MAFYKVLFFVAFLACSANALKCYSCTLAISEGDDNVNMACVDKPADAVGKPVITCPARMKYCTIVRNDYKDTNTVSSIERNCAENPVILNEDIDGPDMIYHYRACTTDLCNYGTGLENPNANEGGGGQGGMILDGSGSAGLSSSFVTLIAVSILYRALLFLS